MQILCSYVEQFECSSMPESTVNNESHPAPAWLTRDYVQGKLRKYYENEKLQLQQLEIKPGTAKGENYASLMTRINVVFDTESVKSQAATFLVKTTFADKDPASHILKHYGIYTREMDMYESILPKFTDLLRELGDKRQLFAATVNVDRAKASIIFEDLSHQQYTVASRLKCLDLAHTQLVLDKLAKLHAMAAVLNEREPGIFAQNFDRGFFNRQTRGYQPIMQEMLRALMRYVETDEQLHRRYHHKLVHLCDNIMDYCERTTDVNEDDFMTLTHGDIWTTNVMFHYEQNEAGTASSKPDNAILIDFQFCMWTSPAIDLHYFFSTSLQRHLWLQQTELVQFYYYKLVDALRQLKFGGKVPSLFDFHMQFKAREAYAIFASLIFQPVMIYNGEEELDIAIIVSDTPESRRKKDTVFQNAVMQQKIRELLPIMDHKGLLDNMS